MTVFALFFPAHCEPLNTTWPSILVDVPDISRAIFNDRLTVHNVARNTRASTLITLRQAVMTYVTAVLRAWVEGPRPFARDGRHRRSVAFTAVGPALDDTGVTVLFTDVITSVTGGVRLPHTRGDGAHPHRSTHAYLARPRVAGHPSHHPVFGDALA